MRSDNLKNHMIINHGEVPVKRRLEEKDEIESILMKYMKPKPLSELINPAKAESSGSEEEEEMVNPAKSSSSSEEEGEEEAENLAKPDGSSRSEEEVKFLPQTRNGLIKRFTDLYPRRTKNRNELVFLLDEMKRRGCIEPMEYDAFNNVLSKACGYGLDETDKLKGLIKSTTAHLIKNDKRMIVDLINEIKESGDISEVEDLVKRYLDGEPVFSEIVELLPRLEEFGLSTPAELKMMLNRVDRENYRVFTVLRRLNEVNDQVDLLNTLNSLAREELITDLEYDKLLHAPLNITDFAKIIKERSSKHQV